MEKRLILAVLLMSAVIMLSNLLFPPPEPEAGEAEEAAAVESAVPGPAPVAARPDVTGVAEVAGPEASIAVSSALYRYTFATRGAALVGAELLEFPSYTRPGPVQLVPEGSRDFLAQKLVVSGDTIELARLPFRASAPELALGENGGPRSLVFEYSQPDGFAVQITYTFSPDEYLVDVRGAIRGLGGANATVLTVVGPGLEPNEAADHHSERELAFVTRAPGEVDRFLLRKLREPRGVEGPLTWAGVKDKYFFAGVLAADETPLTGAVVEGLPAVRRPVPGRDREIDLPQGRLTTALPLGSDGSFAYRLYLGPQEYQRLAAIGYDLENVTQYAYRWLEPVIRPVAAAILWVLVKMHATMGLAYGWVLVMFGVLMRIVLWPLNAKAMRSQMKNMAVQPLMQEIRDRYKNDPQKQQEELLRLYKEHGFNPVAGCLPLLIPFPVLITLFFVFQNTISFRGASFLWLPDLSLHDPLYILPIILVVSMFGLQWVSAHLSGMEQNPQMKMMMYFMPIMMGVIFFNLPSGLNLYYATTNVASIPQQVLIARERKRAKEQMEAEKAATDGPTKPPRRQKKARGRG